MNDLLIKTTKREKKLKNIGTKSLKQGFIPGILYNKRENTCIQVDRHDFEKIFPSIQPNSVLTVELGKKRHRAFLKDYALSLKNRSLQHIDFFVVSETSEVTVPTPIAYRGQAKGVLRGGVLQSFERTLLVRGEVKALPEVIEVDISGLDIGDHLIVGDLPGDDSGRIAFMESLDKVVVGVAAASRKEEVVEAKESEEMPEETSSESKEQEDPLRVMRTTKLKSREIKLIVGCGNPGMTYEKTRHNVGFKCIDFLAETLGMALDIEKKKSIYGRKVIDDKEVVLLKPQTFMLHLGEAVLYLASFLKVEVSNIFVIFDDIQSPFSKVVLVDSTEKILHNAVKSLKEALVRDDFVKCAIGIGPLPGNIKEEDYYLDPFLESELRQLSDIFKHVEKEVAAFLKLSSTFVSAG